MADKVGGTLGRDCVGGGGAGEEGYEEGGEAHHDCIIAAVLLFAEHVRDRSLLLAAIVHRHGA